MKKFLFTLVVAILVATTFAVEEEDDVLILTNSNFDDVVNNADLILVEFYAPWCGHCKKLTPEYASAAKTLKKNNPAISLAKVDATVESALGSRFGVTGYPTLKVFRRGSPVDYKGPRDSAGIVSYMIKQVGDSAKLLKTVEEFDKFIDNRDISIIGFFPSKSGMYNTFIKAADQNREDFRFGLVTDDKIMSEKKFGSSIVIFRPFDDKKQVVYSGNDNVNSIVDWIYANSLPFIGEWSKTTEARYKKVNKPVFKAYFDVDFGVNLKKTNYYINRIKKGIEGVDGIKDKIQFAVLNKKAYKDEITKYGLDSAADVQFAVDDFTNNLRYRPVNIAKEFSIDSVKDFLTQYNKGEIKPYIKSEPIPENNDEPGKVKIVVGETFNSIVMDKSKYVLFEMYAPWCGHCKKLEPIYQELAESLKDEESIVIAKMDATANDTPHSKYQAKGYPTIFWSGKDNKDAPVPYSGERTVKAFTDFIKEKTGLKLKSSSKKQEL